MAENENDEIIGLESAEEAESALPVEGLGSEEDAKPEAEEKPREVQDKGEVPEKYSFEESDDGFNESVGSTARELGLTQDQAQKFVSAVEKANGESLYRIAKEWQEGLKSDPEIGGDKFDQSLGTARAVFDRYATDKDFRNFLASSGITNHPDFIRMFVRIGNDMKLAGAKKSMFPNSRMGG